MNAGTSAKRGPRPAEQRLRRLLVMLPWLMDNAGIDGVAVSEVAARFDLTESEVVRDLELVAMCGLPPFVDEMIDVFVDEGVIWVGVPRVFTRPLRLTSVEAFELLTAGRAAQELPGFDANGPLARGLTKLAAALGADDNVQIDLDRPATADDLAAYVVDGAEVEIDYWTESRDASSTRLIVPRQVFSDRGEWYVSADDDRSGEVRTFRIDRISSYRPTGRTGVATDRELPTPGEWFSDASVPRAVLSLSPSARWVIERYPVDSVSEPDERGWVTVRLPLASERWLLRTLLRLGPDAVLIEPVGFGVPLAEAAQSILRRYSDNS